MQALFALLRPGAEEEEVLALAFGATWAPATDIRNSGIPGGACAGIGRGTENARA